MPKRRGTRAKNRPSSNFNSTTISSVNASSSTIGFNETGASMFGSWQDELEAELQESLKELDNIAQGHIDVMEQRNKTFLLALSDEQRQMKVDINDKRLIQLISAIYSNCGATITEQSTIEVSSDDESCQEPPRTVKARPSRAVARKIPPTTTVSTLRRSRSARPMGMAADSSTSDTGRRPTRRSQSANINFKTPMKRVLVPNAMTANKYTVSKASRLKESAVMLQRIIRPNEEAISTSGSPLFILPTVSQPTISIPLNDGMVMKVEANRPEPRELPELDEATKQSINSLFNHLKWIKDAM